MYHVGGGYARALPMLERGFGVVVSPLAYGEPRGLFLLVYSPSFACK